MKILIIMSGFFPGKKYGGPPVSIANFCSLMTNHQCYIVTKNHDMGETKPYANIGRGWNSVGNASVMYLSDQDFNYGSFDTVIKEISPDVIYLQSLFDYKTILPSLKLAKHHNLPVIWASRGELCKGAFKKKYKKLPYISMCRLLGFTKNVVFQSTSDEETEAIHKYMGVSKDYIKQLPNIPSIPSDTISHLPKLQGTVKLLFISRIVKKKNLHSALSYLMNVKGDVLFDIYGPLESSEYWNECEGIISRLPSNVKVKYCGAVSHDEVSGIFSTHDTFLFPTFSENYGHVIAESLVNGCLPIISDQTPWNDINSHDAGWAISLSEEDEFVKAINKVISLDEKSMSEYRKNIKAYIHKKMNIEEIKELYEQLLNIATKNK